MRKVIDLQMKLGETPILEVKFDPRSRDEIPKLLRGLQAIYADVQLRGEIFQVLLDIAPPSVNPNNGRKGMDLWKIFVLGTLRLNCNWDFDKLLEIANNHFRVRQMLGHGPMDADYQYSLQTLRDNLSLLTPDVLNRINPIVVAHGHKISGKNNNALRGSCDPFVVEADVHFPTDRNLLFDAIRVMISLTMKICAKLDMSDWRQGKHHIRKVKNYAGRSPG